MKHLQLDDIDKELLNILQNEARMPLKEVAKTINLSSPAVASRIRRLEEEGFIRGYQAQVDPILLGLYTKAFILLEVTPTQKKEFYPYIRACKSVVECNCVTGDYSMLLEVYFKNTIELDQFIGELQRFGRTKTLIVFSASVEHRGINIE